MSGYRAMVTVITWAAGDAGHEIGDFAVQRDWDARNKQVRSWTGRCCLLRHGLTYGASQLAAKLVAYRAAGVRVPLTAVLAGQVVEVVLHVVIDDGRLLFQFADKTGKRALHDLAAGGVNGRMLMDQAIHKSLQIPAGALVTGALAAWIQS